MTRQTTCSGKVLVVDDMPASVELLRRLLVAKGYEVLVARDGREALEIFAQERPDLVLMDVVMPELSGLEVCQQLKYNPESRLTPVVLLTGLQDEGSRVRGIEAGADDFLTKPVNVPELQARVRSLVRLKRFTDDLDSAASLMVTMALMIEARDEYTQAHCQRLACYATALGQQLGLDEEELVALNRGGFLHDIGKLAVSDAILLKKGNLSRVEYEHIKQHTIVGDRLCGALRSLARVRTIVRHHHERLDGSGYPDGLRGDRVPLLAQVIGIVDVYDALTTARPYKPAWSFERACEELVAEARLGRHRRDLVEMFIALGPQRVAREASAPVKVNSLLDL